MHDDEDGTVGVRRKDLDLLRKRFSWIVDGGGDSSEGTMRIYFKIEGRDMKMSLFQHRDEYRSRGYDVNKERRKSDLRRTLILEIRINSKIGSGPGLCIVRDLFTNTCLTQVLLQTTRKQYSSHDPLRHLSSY